KQTYIQPKHSLGERPYRFNWQTPILLSSHNQDILYLGSQKLHRSFNQGDTWTAISGDLTKGPKQGNVSYGTLTTISESPFDFNTLVVGSDDGLVSLTRDSGVTWKSISAELPKDLWVTRVVASAHEASRIYATLNGYRWDDFTPYVYVSEDYGQSWRSLSDGLPLGAVNVIREDPTHADLLYLGTD
ncbi:MAG TPA: glycosyl hydrolase, partial [Flavobacteriaceae bacterium]|nr:glycosyl hydrolase [Flavobacteriaceae bacterium]